MSSLRVKFGLGIILFLFLPLSFGLAATKVLICSGLAGDQEETDRLNELQTRLSAAFRKRGFPSDSLEVKGEVTKPIVLEAIARLGKTLQPQDSFWLVLLGHTTLRDGHPVFNVAGPRLSVGDLKSALDPISAGQILVLTTESSGAYIDDLKAPNRIIITATETEGEVNQTVFPEMFAQALETSTSPSLLDLIRETAKNIHADYEQKGVAESEHAMLSDPALAAPLEEPFEAKGQNPLASQTPLPASGDATMASAGNLLPPAPTSAEKAVSGKKAEGAVIEQATPETLAIMARVASVKKLAETSSAVVLSKEMDCLVNNDKTQVTNAHFLVYIAKPSGEHRGDLGFVYYSSSEGVSIKNARTIFPDGTFSPVEMHPYNEQDDPEEGHSSSLSVRFPALHPGCVIEYTLRREERPSGGLPGLYSEIPITDDIPIVSCQFTLRLPKDGSVIYKVRNLPGDPVKSSEAYADSYRWKWENLAAVEQLRYDPPLTKMEGKILLTSYKTWDDFVAWFRHLAAGSDRGGPLVAERAKVLTAGLKSDDEKLRALYLDVCKVRYAAIELGVHGFRPHSPESVLKNNFGDCKDKANLLIALAREVGIEGNLVLLNRGSSADPSIPGFQFNHAIAYFPKMNGGLFLDSTDEVNAYGQLPPGDVGQNALVIGASAETIQPIPVSPAQASKLDEEIQVDLTGQTPSSVKIKAHGLPDYYFRAEVGQMTERQVDGFLRDELTHFLPGASLKSYTVSDLDKLDLPVEINLKADLLPGVENHVAETTPVPFGLMEATATEDRKYDLVLNDGQPFIVAQRLVLSGGQLEKLQLPPDLAASTGDVSVRLAYTKEGAAVIRTLTLTVNQATVSPQNYPAFRKIIQQVYAAILNAPNLHPASVPSHTL